MAGVALYRCCAEPVTPLHIHVDPVKSPVFGKGEVFRPGDAPKATRRPISTASRLADLRFGKGIRVKAAKAQIFADDSSRIFGINVKICPQPLQNTADGVILSIAGCVAHLGHSALSKQMAPRKFHPLLWQTAS